MKSPLIKTALLAFALALGACQSMPQPVPACAAGEAMIETQLFFGLAKKRGEVTAAEWRDFLHREVVPRFSQGFTVIDARGFWLNGELKKTISERSKVIVRLHPEGAEHDRAIGEITDAYKKRFAQESVLRVDRGVCAQF
jgi:Protein of unknown function (DUF3574)